MMHRARPAEPADRVASVALAAARADIRQKLDARQEIVDSDFEAAFWDTAVRQMFAATHGGELATCAYCQMCIFGGGYGVIDHFAPRTEVCRKLVNPGAEALPPLPNVRGKSFDGPFKPAYAWRAYDWDNFVLSCPHCNTGWKSTLFPATCDGQPVNGPAVEGRAEVPLLLDPYDNDDDPRTHLVFTEDGGVGHRDRRGRWTIDVLGLDRRASLSLARLRLIDRVIRLCKALELTQIVELGDANAELSAVVRDIAQGALSCTWDEIVRAAA